MQKQFFKKHVALTQEHGSWVFLFMPLIVGLFAGGTWTAASGFLLLTALAAFLFKQPLTMAVKIMSGRRGRQDLPAAYFWMAVYGVMTLVGFVGMWGQGVAWLLILALPGIPVLGWYLFLVTRRAERRQIGVEIVASGALALGAPAAYWIGLGKMDTLGWCLWLLIWFQSAASIVYAALRLTQREWKEKPELAQRLHAGGRALGYTGFNLGLAVGLGAVGMVTSGIAWAFGLQFAEALWGSVNPAIGLRPARIGFRQLVVSILFTILFVVFWKT
ncbi:MAG: YwiC-like family protein [Anaerolineales bacterium]|nr:YwiC-like family protein [Anaerolineales bacterium]